MNRFMTFLCSCPLLLVSGVALCINQDIENIYSSPYTQEQINQLRQSKNKATGYPVVPPEKMYDEFGPDRYKSPDGMYIDMNAKPAEPFGPVSIPGPFRPDTLNP